MTLELTFGESFCYTPIFKINGIDADSNDFGEQYDRDSGNAEEGEWVKNSAYRVYELDAKSVRCSYLHITRR